MLFGLLRHPEMKRNRVRGEMKIRIALVAVLWLSLHGVATQASNDKAACEVMTILASNSGQGIDTALREFRHLLIKEPFSKFDTFKLVSKQAVEIDDLQPKKLSLPDGIGGSLYLNRRTKGKMALTLTLTRDGKRPISINGTAAPGAPLFAAGMKSGNGVWIFGVACENNPSAPGNQIKEY